MDRYDLIDKLGSGAQSIVYLANDKKRDLLVVLKVSDYNSDAGIGRAARNEINILKVLTTTEMYSDFYERCFRDGSQYIIVMDSSYKSLKCISHDNFDMINKIGEQLLENIELIHDCNIIHRDIKPDNIVISMKDELDDSEPDVKIIDFGCSIHRDKLPTSSSLAGTFNYLYPKLVQLFELNDFIPFDEYLMGDYYSILSTLYFLLCGKTPNTEFIKGLNREAIEDKFRETKSDDFELMFCCDEWIKFVKLYPRWDKLKDRLFVGW